VVDEETQAQIFQIAFEEAWDKLKGFFITNWSRNLNYSYNIHGLKAEEIIREWAPKTKTQTIWKV